MYRISKWIQARERTVLLMVWSVALLSLLIALFLFHSFRPVTVSFVDVGQGDSCLIQAGKNGNVLIDGGDEGQGASLVSYLENRNVPKLNAVFLSHFHDDHATGILELLDSNFPIERFYISEHQSYTDLENKLLSKAKSKSIPVFRLREGDEITLGKVKYRVISQEPYKNENEINNMSMVLRASYGSSSVLFTGDLETNAAKRLLSDPAKDVKADILKIPHHGGISSVSDELISRCNPAYAIINVGENYYGNPSKEMLSCLTKRNISVYRTDRDGAIVITLGKKDIRNIVLGNTRR